VRTRKQLSKHWLLTAVAVGLAVSSMAACSEGADDDSDRPTAAEYRQAVELTRSCVEDAGFSVGPIAEAPDGISLQFSIDTPEGAEADVDAAYSACEEEHLLEVATAYLGGRHLTGEAREQAMQELVDCLENAGITGLSVAETDSRVFVRAIMDYGEDSPEASAGLLCMDRYRDVWPPGDANNP